MNKRNYSILNLVLSVILFLAIYGHTCYRAALPSKGGSDFIQQIFICLYFFSFILISLYCIFQHPYYSNKCFWISAIYCLLLHFIFLIVWIYSKIAPNVTAMPFTWIEWIIFILPLAISGLFILAGLKKE